MILNGMEFNIFQQKIGKYPNPLSAKFLNIQRILTKTNETLQKKHRPRRKKQCMGTYYIWLHSTNDKSYTIENVKFYLFFISSSSFNRAQRL